MVGGGLLGVLIVLKMTNFFFACLVCGRRFFSSLFLRENEGPPYYSGGKDQILQ